MTGTEHYTQQIGYQRTEKSNKFRMLSQNFLRNLKHALKTSGSLKYSGTSHNRQNNQHNVHRSMSRRHTQHKHLYDKTDP